MMIEFDIFLTRVLPAAVACPEPFAIQKIRDAAIEVCERGRVWRVRDHYTRGPKDGCEILAAPDEAAIVEVRSVRFNDGRPLEPISSLDLDDLYPNWRDDETCGTPRYVTQLGTDTVAIYPRGIGKLHLELILKPSITAEMLPGVLADHHLELIANGALARILSAPARDFANPQLAATHFQLFNRALDKLSTGKGPKGQQRAPLRTRSRFV